MSLLSLTSDEGSAENVSSPLLVELKSQASTSQRNNAQPRATSYKREAVVRKVTSGGIDGSGSIQAAAKREGGWYVMNDFQLCCILAIIACLKLNV